MVRTDHQIRAAVTEYVRALKAKIRVERVILYGSYAAGTAREDSDIDIAVLSPDFARMSPLEVIQTLAHRMIHCDSMLMPVGYSPAQFDDPDNAFAREIARTGKVIYRAPRRRAGRRTARASGVHHPASHQTGRELAKRHAKSNNK